MVNQRKAGVFLSYTLTATNALVGFIYIPLLIYFLGQKEYGLYQLMGSFLAYLGLFDFGLSNTVTRYYSKYIALKDKKGKENLLALSTIIYILLTLLLIIVGTIFYFYLDSIFMNSLTEREIDVAKQMYIIILITAAITVSTSVFNSIIAANERFIFLKGISIVQVIIRPIIILIIFSFEANALIVVLVQAFINIFGVVLKVYYSFIKLKVKIIYHYWDKQLLKEIFRYSFFIFITVIMDQIFWRSDQLVLGAIEGTSSVAIYSIGFQIVTYYMTLSTAMTGVFLPNITKMVMNNSTNSELTSIFVKIGRLQYILLGAILTGFILYGKEFITLWAGTEFSQSYYIALIIMLPFTIDLIQNIGLTILQAKNMYGFRATVFFAMAIFKIAVSIPLAINYGGIGTAFATGISYLIGNGLVMNYYYYKKVRLNIYKFWTEIFKLSIPIAISLIVGIFIRELSFGTEIISLLTKMFLFAIFYIIILWLLGMNRYEKSLFLGPIKRLGSRVKHKNIN